MGRYCSDCANFNTKDKEAPGYCKCKKIKKYVFANMPECKNFSKSYSRGWYEKEKLYDEGKASSNKWSGKEISILVPIILIILLIILKLFHLA